MSDHLLQREARSTTVDHPCEIQSHRLPRRPGTSGRKPRRLSRFERWLLRRLLAAIGDPPVTVVLPDGEEIAPPREQATSRVTVCDRATLWKLVLNPVFQFPEAYAAGAIEVEGMEELLASVYQRFNQNQINGTRMDRLLLRLRMPHSNTLAKSRDNIHHHYDIGNDFYRLWLDRQMVYTCAYFAKPSFTLEQAQVAKMDHVCRKLRLRSGMTVYEAGCGWGALALHMARHYGVKVRAFNISREQIAYARQQAHQQRLEDRVEFVEDDWRNISGQCDAFVSVGMLEHLGKKNYRRLSDVIHACLVADGVGLIHSIGQNFPGPLNPWIERRIFPGAYPPSLREMMDIFEPHGFSVLDVENLRLHYAETLRHWLERYERCNDVVRAQFDERFVRTWRLYLAASIVAFESGGLQLFQVLFARGPYNDLPSTRAHLYTRPSRRSRGSNGSKRRKKLRRANTEVTDGCPKE